MERSKQMTRRQVLSIMAAAAAVALTDGRCRAESEMHPLCFAVSAETLAGANLNDARAAYKIWLREIYGQLGNYTAEPVPDVFIASEDLVRGVRQGTLDCYGMTALEFAKVVDLTDPDSLVVEDYMADGMEYVLLVHSGSRFKQLADLRGAQVLSHLHRDMVLLPTWLSAMLAADNLPAPEHFFGSNKLIGSLNQVVLPVFFGHGDGALLARRSWETAMELNPQLGHDLRVLAVSPKVIPILFGFRRNANPNARKALIDSIQRVYSVPAGRQIIALYQSTAFVVRPVSAMKGTLDLIRQHDRLSAKQAASGEGHS
jgi:ABC-type phosphate/phosphonate transport system substrate-binding protein